MSTLKDLRRTPRIQTMDQARALFDLMAVDTIKLEAVKATGERRIAILKQQIGEKLEPLQQRIEAAEIELAAYIEGNQELFQKPRKVKTDYGSFGLHTAEKVEWSDKVAALDSVVRQKLTDCYETVKKLVPASVKKALQNGEEIDGAELRSGELAICTVSKALLDEAKKPPKGTIVP